MNANVIPSQQLAKRFGSMSLKQLRDGWRSLLVDSITATSAMVPSIDIKLAINVIHMRLCTVPRQCGRKGSVFPCELTSAILDLAPGEWMPVDHSRWSHHQLKYRMRHIRGDMGRTDIHSVTYAGNKKIVLRDEKSPPRNEA